MEKIKIVTDSASDILDSALEEYGIEMLCISIAVDGVSYHERQDFTFQEYYSMLETCKEVPVTSKIPEWKFLDCYKRAYEQGYTTLIAVTLSGRGSATYESAVLARNHFYEENPDAKEKFKIYLVDSRIYTIAVGHPVTQAGKMAKEGKSSQEILDYLADWFDTVEVILSVYTLRFLKKSGRVSGASAFVGEALGVRPVLSVIEGKTETLDKPRGDKNVVPTVFNLFKKNCVDYSAPVLILYGADKQCAEELADLLEKEIGRRPPMFMAGGAIVTNTGPKPIAVVYRGKARGISATLTN